MRPCPAIVFAAALAIAGIAAAPAPGPASPQDDWRALPPALRAMLHYHARDVPTFPNEDTALVRVENWPRFRVVDGTPCRLEFTMLSIGSSAAHHGPAYRWFNDGTLYERSYHRGHGWQAWIYDPEDARRLTHYQVTPELNHGVALDEDFDHAGRLVGVYAGSKPLGSKHYWRGREVDSKEFMALMRQMREGGGGGPRRLTPR